MPFIRSENAYPRNPKLPCDIFPGETQFWEAVRDNLAPWTRRNERHVNPDLAPVRPGFGYEVRAYYKSPSGDVEVHKGAQGQIVGLPTSKAQNGYVQINIPEIGQNRVVPMAILRCGSVHVDHRTCEIREVYAQGVKAAMATQEGVPPDQLSKAIQAFLSTLAASDIHYLNADFYDVIGGKEARHAMKYTRIFHAGVQAAGLLDVLNMPDFNLSNIRQNAREIASNSAPGSGIYLRITLHRDGKRGIIVGRTNSFGERFKRYTREIVDPDATRAHIRACRVATSYHMYELCRLPNDLSTNITRLAEQTFTSLFGSYYESLLRPGNQLSAELMKEAFATGDDPYNTNRFRFCLAANRFTAVATAAAQKSGWPGVTTRASSGITSGHNIDSPLLEWLVGDNYERYLWIRRDTFAPSKGDIKEPIPVAIIRRSIPVTAHWTTYSRGNLKFVPYTLPIPIRREGQIQRWFSCGVRAITDHTLANGEDYPKEGDLVQIVFEVRLDDKPHPLAHCPLSLIGPFEDWHRAMSWAFRFEWKSPTGKWKRCYMRKRGNKLIEEGVRGALTNYVFGMAVLRWLLKEAPDQHTLNRSWMYSFPPFHVMRIHVDFLRQEVSLQQVPNGNTRLTSARLDDASIERIMNQPQWLFGRVGANPQHILITDTKLDLSASVIDTLNLHPSLEKREKCDGCILRSRGPCKLIPGKEVCTRCYNFFGRPKCTYTLGLSYVRSNFHTDLDARFGPTQEAVESALVMPSETQNVSIDLGADPKLVEVRILNDESDDDMEDSDE